MCLLASHLRICASGLSITLTYVPQGFRSRPSWQTGINEYTFDHLLILVFDVNPFIFENYTLSNIYNNSQLLLDSAATGSFYVIFSVPNCLWTHFRSGIASREFKYMTLERFTALLWNDVYYCLFVGIMSFMLEILFYNIYKISHLHIVCKRRGLDPVVA